MVELFSLVDEREDVPALFAVAAFFVWQNLPQLGLYLIDSAELYLLAFGLIEISHPPDLRNCPGSSPGQPSVSQVSGFAGFGEAD